MPNQNSQIHNIIWDWNGTLLNDVRECYQVVRNLALDHELNDFTTEEYQSVFGFPIRDYYIKLGFDFDKVNYEELAGSFIKEYLSLQPALYSGTVEILHHFKSTHQQEIISAYNNHRLQEIVVGFGLESFFRSIQGIDNDLAASKLHLFKNRFQLIDPKESVIIGDTLHDAEIAHECGAGCVLISQGHQSHERLEGNLFGYQVVRNFTDLLSLQLLK